MSQGNYFEGGRRSVFQGETLIPALRESEVTMLVIIVIALQTPCEQWGYHIAGSHFKRKKEGEEHLHVPAIMPRRVMCDTIGCPLNYPTSCLHPPSGQSVTYPRYSQGGYAALIAITTLVAWTFVERRMVWRPST